MKDCITANQHIFRDGKCVICGYVYEEGEKKKKVGK